MNLVEFKVTEIISEENDKVYNLLHMIKEDANQKDEAWKKILFSPGVRQTYRYIDAGGESTASEVFYEGKEKYYVGYIGQH